MSASLSGGLVLSLSVVLAVLAAAATVLLWPRLAGPRPRHYAGRAAVLVLQNVMLLLAVAVGMNDTFQFFADWSDLAGALRGQAGPAAGAASPSAGATGGATARSYRPAPPVLPVGVHGEQTGRQGDVLRFRVGGGPSGVSADVYVAVPADYDQQVRAGHRFPVLEAFSGYPSDPRQWLSVMGLEHSLSSLAARRQIAETLVVMPTVELPPGTDTECVDGGAAAAQVERWVAEDVPAWVESALPVQRGSQAWAGIGLSTGGYCAAMVAMRHPGVYGAAISFAGYYRPEFESGYQPFSRTSLEGQRYDLVRLARLAPPPVSLWALTSRADTLSYASTMALLQAARPPFSVRVETLLHAGHRTAVLKPWVPTALRWLAASLPGFAPAR